ncbi:MAG: MFS transporter [Nitrososphaerota archaeon]|nr:MFS transporter [Nitrososphaerota archaeon]
MSELPYIFTSKSIRVFAFGLVSIVTPIYVALLGYSSVYVGIVLMAMILGNIFSNMLIIWYGNYIGRRPILLIFSFLMFLSGLILYSTTDFPLILIGAFIGNISTTGTESGPFQSIETGILPSLVGEKRYARTFGVYNFLGYAASSLGALAASTPYYFHNSISVFHFLYLFYGVVGILLLLLYLKLKGSVEVAQSKPGAIRPKGLANVSLPAKRDIRSLSALYATDALGGGFLTQSILVYWFFLVYHLSLSSLGPIFFFTNLITALSALGASFVAEKLGNLRTMVYTHLVSNVFVILIPLAGSLALALSLLFLRQSMSQMDVPTRQAFMSQIFTHEERVSANAITNTSRSIASMVGSPVTGAVLSAGLVSLPLFAGGFTKIAYDLLIYLKYKRRVR